MKIVKNRQFQCQRRLRKLYKHVSKYIPDHDINRFIDEDFSKLVSILYFCMMNEALNNKETGIKKIFKDNGCLGFQEDIDIFDYMRKNDII